MDVRIIAKGAVPPGISPDHYVRLYVDGILVGYYTSTAAAEAAAQKLRTAAAAAADQGDPPEPAA